MKILFLSPWNPYPPNNGSKLRIHGLIRGLSEHHELRILALSDLDSTRNSGGVKSEHPPIDLIPRRRFEARSISTLRWLAARTPRVVIATRVAQFRMRIQSELAGDTYDLVIASQWNTASYAEEFNGTPAVFDELELGSFTSKVVAAKNPLARFRHRLSVLKMQAYLRRLLPRFEVTTVASEIEAKLVHMAVPKYEHLETVPNFIDVESFPRGRRNASSRNLIFTGSLTYFANYDAIEWFLSKIYPQVVRAFPSSSLTITGDHNNLHLSTTKNVNLTGEVADVRPLVSDAAISIAPYRLGGGTRLKVIEAMALCTPVIATSKGVEGLDVIHGEHLLIADEPDEYADAVLQILGDPSLGRSLADNAYALVQEKYDYSVVIPKFLEIVERSAGG